MSASATLYGGLCGAYILNSPLEGIYNALWSSSKVKGAFGCHHRTRRETWIFFRTLCYSSYSFKQVNTFESGCWLKALSIAWLFLVKADSSSFYMKILTNPFSKDTSKVSRGDWIFITSIGFRYNILNNDGIKYNKIDRIYCAYLQFKDSFAEFFSDILKHVSRILSKNLTIKIGTSY